ncbi:hypothetical protein BT96DRAFT_939270 [Gymnopus androsaceus JB14]|uniref:Uncharacterized protein n=1 Tax=Gymnopus androsaceus JB14 TaxID=1447944 RepID=A0A6A4HRJ7_9AGAR|nr:hypothetical protein BT96DRAFT_939270 [Gymnopus androsaceus JB14]
MSANDSASCGNVFGAGDFRTDQVGFFMEGLAVLPGDTSLGKQNISVNTLRSNVVNITLMTNIYCNLTNGIIPATNPNSNIYAGSWTGPPVAEYEPTNQTMAIFALVNSAQVTNETSSNSAKTEGSNANDSTTAHTSDAGLIAGGIVGGLAVLAEIALCSKLSTTTENRDASTGRAGLHDIKRPQIQVMNCGQSNESQCSIDPVSAHPPNTTDSARIEEIPTGDLLQVLQERIQREGGLEQAVNAPPVYETL